MGKQKHDIGWQKKNRQSQQTHSKPTNPNTLAFDLVKRGLASTSILNSAPARKIKNND